jgi:hypothetical protein
MVVTCGLQSAWSWYIQSPLIKTKVLLELQCWEWDQVVIYASGCDEFMWNVVLDGSEHGPSIVQ